MSNSNEPHIAIIKFEGKNGSFSSTTSTLYRCEIRGVNGKTHRTDYPGSERHYSVNQANYWSELTGFPIKEFEEQIKPQEPVLELVELKRESEDF